jgi:hypothetical protein
MTALNSSSFETDAGAIFSKLGMGSGAEDRALVVLQHLQPRTDVVGVIFAVLQLHAAISARAGSSSATNSSLA